MWTAKLMVEEECEEIVDDKFDNKTVLVRKQIENWKPFIASSILLISVSIILSGSMIYFYCKSKNRDVLPY